MRLLFFTRFTENCGQGKMFFSVYSESSRLKNQFLKELIRRCVNFNSMKAQILISQSTGNNLA